MGGDLFDLETTAVTVELEQELMVDMVEAAKIARVSVDAMRSLVHRYPAQLPTTRYGSARKYVRYADLMTFLRGRQFS